MAKNEGFNTNVGKKNSEKQKSSSVQSKTMPKRKGFGSNMFQKDPDVLPFFCIHPKTRVGAFLRISMCVFCILAIILMFLFNRGIMFLWLPKYYFLSYLVPIGVLFALIVLALFKRMRTTFTKIAVPGILLFFGFIIFMSIASVMATSSSYALAPQMMIQRDDKIIVLMRSCENPESVMVEENGVESERFLRTLDAYRFSVRVPEAREGVSYTIEGDIYIPIADGIEYEVKEEWVDDNTFRMYIAKDTSEVGKGEIIVRFAPGETTPASEPASSSMTFRKEFSKGENKVYFYRETSKMTIYVDSPYYLSDSDMRQIYVAAPRTAFAFVNLNNKMEGGITVEPGGTLDHLLIEWNDDETVVRIAPTEDCKGASGEILLYFDNDGKPRATWGEATAVEATTAEATTVEATAVEATTAEATAIEATDAEAALNGAAE